MQQVVSERLVHLCAFFIGPAAHVVMRDRSVGEVQSMIGSGPDAVDPFDILRSDEIGELACARIERHQPAMLHIGQDDIAPIIHGDAVAQRFLADNLDLP